MYVGEVWGESKVIWGNSSQQIPKKSALRFKNQVKSFIIWSDAESKGKKTALVCLEHFYELFATENSNLEGIIWSDGSTSELNIASHLLRTMLLCICKGGLGSSFPTISYENYCKELHSWWLLCTVYTFNLKSSFRI